MRKGKKGTPSEPPRPAAGAPAPRALRRSPEADTQALLHELRVHQVELEMQNDELRSARLETEGALARYTELFDFAPIGYALLRADHGIADINHAGAQLCGRPRSLLRDRRFDLLVEPRQQSSFRNLLLAAEASGTRQSCELALLGGGGLAVCVRLSASVLPSKERHAILAFEDIGEHKLREEQLARAEGALRDVDRRQREFLGALSHELRNPLAPIQTSLFVLDRSEGGSDTARRAQAIIARQVTQLTRLIDDLLDGTRISQGELQLRLEPLDLNTLLRRTIDDHEASFAARGVGLEIGELPEAPLWVRGDAGRLVQVLNSVLSNALKFTPSGGRAGVLLERRPDFARLQVSDNGAGIAAEALEPALAPSTQGLQTIGHADAAQGLGLALVKGLLELQGGQIQIESGGFGRGTCVTLRLPLCAPPAAVGASAPPAPHRARRVLVIENDPDTREALAAALKLNGHEVWSAPDARSGLELAARLQPEVVLCDIGLRGMDGYAFARAFRSERALRDAFLIALSGYARPEAVQRSRDAGFDRHLSKPASIEELERALGDAP